MAAKSSSSTVTGDETTFDVCGAHGSLLLLGKLGMDGGTGEDPLSIFGDTVRHGSSVTYH